MATYITPNEQVWLRPRVVMINTTVTQNTLFNSGPLMNIQGATTIIMYGTTIIDNMVAYRRVSVR